MDKLHTFCILSSARRRRTAKFDFHSILYPERDRDFFCNKILAPVETSSFRSNFPKCHNLGYEVQSDEYAKKWPTLLLCDSFIYRRFLKTFNNNSTTPFGRNQHVCEWMKLTRNFYEAFCYLRGSPSIVIICCFFHYSHMQCMESVASVVVEGNRSFYCFLIHISTLSVSQIIWRWMAGSLMNITLERVWKEVVVVEFEVGTHSWNMIIFRDKFWAWLMDRMPHNL